MSEIELIAFQEWLTTVAWHVHDLVRRPAGLERFQKNIWRWYLHVKIRNSEIKGWEIRRDEHIDTVLASPRLRDKAAGPPRYLGVKFLASQPEWEWWETTRPIHHLWRIMGVAGWAPPDLNYNDEPKRYWPVPLTRRALRTEEKYTLLAAIHDHFCKGVKRIGPWPVLYADAESRRDVDEGLLYLVLYHRDVTTDLKAEDRPAIEAFLKDVDEDLRTAGEEDEEVGVPRPAGSLAKDMEKAGSEGDGRNGGKTAAEQGTPHQTEGGSRLASVLDKAGADKAADVMSPAINAREAIRRLGVNFATVLQLASVTGRTAEAIRSRIYRAINKDPKLPVFHVQEIPDPGPRTAKKRYNIETFWEHVQPGSERSQEK